MNSLDLMRYWFQSADEKCTDDYTLEQVKNVEEVRKWLKKQ